MQPRFYPDDDWLTGAGHLALSPATSGYAGQLNRIKRGNMRNKDGLTCRSSAPARQGLLVFYGFMGSRRALTARALGSVLAVPAILPIVAVFSVFWVWVIMQLLVLHIGIISL